MSMTNGLEITEVEIQLEEIFARYRDLWKRGAALYDVGDDENYHGSDGKDLAVLRLLRQQAMAEGTPAPTITQPADPDRAGDDISAGLGRSRPR